MKKRALVYNLINILVLLAAVYVFVCEYRPAEVFGGTEALYIAVIAVTVAIVHFLKAIRLYFALYGANLTFSKYMKIYCKVTPVSVLLPFKSGELFRMYCYGKQTGKVLKGIVTVILDRFMDTIALLAMIMVSLAIYGGNVTTLVYILIVFIVGALLVYMIFPGVYRYWTKYFLRADGTERKIKAIKTLERLNHVYSEISNVTKGRGIILFVLSLLAWSAEIGSVALICNLQGGGGNVSSKISEYLSSALSSSQSAELKQFIFISVVMLMFIYVVVKLIEVAGGERD